jgi:hypothetical protein
VLRAKGHELLVRMLEQAFAACREPKKPGFAQGGLAEIRLSA